MFDILVDLFYPFYKSLYQQFQLIKRRFNLITISNIILHTF